MSNPCFKILSSNCCLLDKVPIFKVLPNRFAANPSYCSFLLCSLGILFYSCPGLPATPAPSDSPALLSSLTTRRYASSSLSLSLSSNTTTSKNVSLTLPYRKDFFPMNTEHIFTVVIYVYSYITCVLCTKEVLLKVC